VDIMAHRPWRAVRSGGLPALGQPLGPSRAELGTAVGAVVASGGAGTGTSTGENDAGPAAATAADCGALASDAGNTSVKTVRRFQPDISSVNVFGSGISRSAGRVLPVREFLRLRPSGG
jgi:hypothetical protein